MKIGARNQIRGKVISVNKGSLMCHVKVRVPAESVLSSVMTIESLKEMGLKKADRVLVVAKAVNVLLLKEE
jgi:molybdopterin-binding protein